jgi:hypothetical protein
VQKIITIGSVGSAPHMREINIYARNACLPFFILPDVYSPNRNSHVDRNTTIDAGFLKEVPFGGVEMCKTNFTGHICPQKLKIS